MAKVRGTSMLPLVKRLRREKERARTELPARLQPYLAKRILYSSWYPEEDWLELARALARILPEEERKIDIWELLGREGARLDLSEVYSVMIREDSPRESVMRLPELWSLYHDTGSMKVSVPAVGQAEIELSGYDVDPREMGRVITGYFAGMLERCGARSLEIKWSVRSGGARWHLRWKERVGSMRDEERLGSRDAR